MISLSRGFLFVHIRKAAGTSITWALSEHADDQVLQAEGDNLWLSNDVMGGQYKHNKAAGYLQVLGAETFDRLLKFACVRDPWERAMSYFLWFCELHGQIQPDPDPEAAFEAVVRQMEPMVDYVDIGGKFALDDLLRFEHLYDDWPRLCQRLGIEEDLGHRNNRSHGRKLKWRYSRRMRSLVADLFSADIERWGYKW